MTTMIAGPEAQDDAGGTSRSLRRRYKIFPLEFLLEAINDSRLSRSLRCQMAVAALPYIHHKLSTIALGGLDLHSRTTLDINKLSDEELVVFERLVMKGQSVAPAQVSSPENYAPE